MRERQARLSSAHGCWRTGAVFAATNEQRVGLIKEDSTMRTLGQLTLNFLKNEDGPTAVEYAVMLALIIVVCITAISALGSNTSNTFVYVGNKVAATSS
jgi:pilus assembly protein Flp/PilA